MVHVLELLGCVATGPTTEAALAASPDAIRAYSRFVRRHGEPADPEAPFTVSIAEHVTEGQWLGNGSPQVVFQPDLQAVTVEEVETLIRRWEWLRAEVIELVRSLSPDQLASSPDGPGRSIDAILRHVLGADRAYMASGLGRVPDLWKLFNAVEKGEQELLDGMVLTRDMAIERIRSMTPGERTRRVQRGKELWTARKMLRRILEHEWEHRVELSNRLGVWLA